MSNVSYHSTDRPSAQSMKTFDFSGGSSNFILVPTANLVEFSKQRFSFIKDHRMSSFTYKLLMKRTDLV